MLKMEKLPVATEGLKLHLGCGTRKIYGFMNVDIREEVKPDINDNILELKKVQNGSASLIYASHLLEHVKRNEVVNVLKRWYEVLQPGGVLRISVPDFEKIVRHYTFHQNIEVLHGLLYARQANEHDFHYIVFDFQFLTKCLVAAGFKEENVTRYNWSETEHFYVDDGSQAYLPHFDKMNGMMMSLNVEAKK